MNGLLRFLGFGLAAGAGFLASACVDPDYCVPHELNCNPLAILLMTGPNRDIQVDPITAVYPAHSAWMEYVVNDGADLFSASGTACTGAEPGWRACFHAGILRSAMTDRDTCDGMTARDFYDVLAWYCDDSDGRAIFYSTGFRPGKKLSDLIDSAVPRWRPFELIVEDGTAAGASPTAQPWQNNLVIDNDGILAAESVSGTIYLVSQDPAALVTLDASKVGYVILPGVVHTGTVAGGETIVTVAGTAPFAWLEGEIDLLGTDNSAFLFQGTFAEGRGLRAYSSPGGSVMIPFTNASNNRLSEVVLANVGNVGIIFSGTSIHNRISELSIYDAGLALQLFAGENLIMNSVITGTTVDAVNVSTADNILLNNTFSGSTGDGIEVTAGGASHLVLANTVFANDTTIGMYHNGFAGGAANYGYANIAAAHNGTNGVAATNGATGNVFSGRLLVGNNGVADCDVTGAGATPGITAACGPQGSSTHTLTTGVDLSSSFVGRVTADDTVNSGDASGSSALGSVVDWASFEHRLRGWSEDASGPMDPVLRGRCTTTCRIWDWSLSSSDTVLRNVLSVPDGDTTHTHTFNSGSTVTFLRNATELLDDGTGDEDGLCEAGERCLYTPNIGAYQGHGERDAFSAIGSGAVSGVTLWRYRGNGR